MAAGLVLTGGCRLGYLSFVGISFSQIVVVNCQISVVHHVQTAEQIGECIILVSTSANLSKTTRKRMRLQNANYMSL